MTIKVLPGGNAYGGYPGFHGITVNRIGIVQPQDTQELPGMP